MPDLEMMTILKDIKDALNRLAPARPHAASLADHETFIWSAEELCLHCVPKMASIPFSLLHGIEKAKELLYANTLQFAKGHAANNALLWGARGMGKSSLIKATFEAINIKMEASRKMALIEIHREDLPTLPKLLHDVRVQERRCLIFCDDLSFDHHDSGYKSLKAVLEGGIEGRPDHVLFYATSNRRHLMPRDMIENERSTAINPSEAVEEKVSLSDRFGLWIGFHPCDQDTYLQMVRAYAQHFNLSTDQGELTREALEWAIGRGSRSGRVAWQFIQDLAGRQEKTLQ